MTLGWRSGDGGRAALLTAARGAHAGSDLLVHADGQREGGLADAELEHRARGAALELMWAERSELLARISATFGLDLGVVSSEEMAASMVELLAVRHGREGGRFSQRGDLDRIH
jgi:xanthine/CO dehydrogenase XdhC/CoxF family maturation factor